MIIIFHNSGEESASWMTRSLLSDSVNFCRYLWHYRACPVYAVHQGHFCSPPDTTHAQFASASATTWDTAGPDARDFGRQHGQRIWEMSWLMHVERQTPDTLHCCKMCLTFNFPILTRPIDATYCRLVHFVHPLPTNRKEEKRNGMCSTSPSVSSRSLSLSPPFSCPEAGQLPRLRRLPESKICAHISRKLASRAVSVGHVASDAPQPPLTCHLRPQNTSE